MKRIEGIPVQPGLVVPADLTVPYLELPTVTYGIQALSPMPEYKPVEYPAYKPEPEGMPKVGYA